jgi:flavin reductase (DIM6/NTAB) family NADH-FMN oxidoreductase RutF
VIPRPIALVSTDGPAGRNAAPFSFFNAVALGPPMLMFSIGPTKFQRAGQDKDTLVNIRATGEFVIQLVDDGNKEKMNRCALEYGSDVDEIALAGFTSAPSIKVKPPRIVECPVQFECVLQQIVELGSTPYHMVIGEVVYAHYRSGIVDSQLNVDMMAMSLIGRLSNPSLYARFTDHFSMPVPPME